MDPGTLSLLAIGGSQVVGGIAAKREQENQAAIAKYNVAVSEQAARQEEVRTAFESQRQAAEATRRQSAIAANLGVSGVVATEGAPLLLRAKQETEDILENLAIGYTGRIAAARKRSQAALFGLEATAARQRGRAAFTSGIIGAGTTVLEGFS